MKNSNNIDSIDETYSGLRLAPGGLMRRNGLSPAGFTTTTGTRSRLVIALLAVLGLAGAGTLIVSTGVLDNSRVEGGTLLSASVTDLLQLRSETGEQIISGGVFRSQSVVGNDQKVAQSEEVSQQEEVPKPSAQLHPTSSSGVKPSSSYWQSYDVENLTKAMVDLMQVPNVDLDGIQCLNMTLSSHVRFVEAMTLSNSTDVHWADKNESLSSSSHLLHDNRGPTTLFYVDWKYIDTVMDRHFFHTYCGAFAVSNFGSNVYMWGPGWPGWDSRMTLQENVDRRYRRPISIVVSKEGSSDQKLRNAIYMTYRLECVYHEKPMEDESRYSCHWYDAVAPWSNNQILLLAFERDFLELASRYINRSTGTFQDFPDVLVYLSQQAPLPGTFVKYHRETSRTAKQFKDRPYDFCFVGSSHPTLYPLRNKILGWIQAGHFEKHGLVAKTLPHFGYTELQSEADRLQRQINANTLEQQYEQYIEFLFNCKSVLVTRSTRDYVLRKYMEAAFAGTLMFGNVPTASSESAIWSQLVVGIDPPSSKNNSIEDVMSTIKFWLSEEAAEARQRKVAEALLYVFSHSTAQHGWSRMMDAYGSYAAGRRGFTVPAVFESPQQVLMDRRSAPRPQGS